MTWLDITFYAMTATSLIGLAWVGWGPRWTIRGSRLPRVGRRRGITVVVLCAVADTLWYWAAFEALAGQWPGWRILVAGIEPWGVGWVTVLLMEHRIERDLKCPSEQAAVEGVIQSAREQAAFERDVLRVADEIRARQVVEGGVLPR